jgi:hypothetical protein
MTNNPQPNLTQPQQPQNHISKSYTSFSSVTQQNSIKPEQSTMNLKDVICMKCKRKGHYTQDCPGFISSSNQPKPQSLIPEDPPQSSWNNRPTNPTNPTNSFKPAYNFPEPKESFDSYLNRNSNPKPSNPSFQSAADTKKTNACFKCGQEGHWSSNCPNNQQPSNSFNKSGPSSYASSFNNPSSNNNVKPGVVCFKCKEPGHISPNCPNSGPVQNNGNGSGGFGGGNGAGNSWKSGPTGGNGGGTGMGGGTGGGGLSGVTCFKCK